MPLNHGWPIWHVRLQNVTFQEYVRIVRVPRWSKYIQRFREGVIVYESCIHRKQPHHHYNISASEENVPYFIIWFHRQKFLLRRDHPESEQEHNETMTKVTEHDSKQEWEGNNGVRGWNICHTEYEHTTNKLEHKSLNKIWSFLKCLFLFNFFVFL